MACRPIYQFYAELDGYKPKVWRRFQVMEDATVAKLAYILMTLFEMQASHLYSFEVDEFENYIVKYKEIYKSHPEYFKKEEDLFKIGQYGCIFDEEDILPLIDNRYRELKNARDVKIRHIINEEEQKMVFNYDFGEDWQINIVLEKIIEDPNIKGRDLPRVLEGEGFGIIEDCGGIGGLEDIREAFKEKKGEIYEVYRDWFETDKIDLDKCDLDDLNFRLKKVPRIYRDIYEYNLPPTDGSLKILYREY